MASLAHGQHAVEHVHTKSYGSGKLIDSPYAHQISRGVFGKERADIFEHIKHLLGGFSNGKAANGIAVESDTLKFLGALLTQVALQTTLHNAKE